MWRKRKRRLVSAQCPLIMRTTLLIKRAEGKVSRHTDLLRRRGEVLTAGGVIQIVGRKGKGVDVIVVKEDVKDRTANIDGVMEVVVRVVVLVVVVDELLELARLPILELLELAIIVIPFKIVVSLS